MKLASTPGSTLLTAAYNLQNGGQYGEVTDNPRWKIPARSGGRQLRLQRRRPATHNELAGYQIRHGKCWCIDKMRF